MFLLFSPIVDASRLCDRMADARIDVSTGRVSEANPDFEEAV